MGVGIYIAIYRDVGKRTIKEYQTLALVVFLF